MVQPKNLSAADTSNYYAFRLFFFKFESRFSKNA